MQNSVKFSKSYHSLFNNSNEVKSQDLIDGTASEQTHDKKQGNDQGRTDTTLIDHKQSVIVLKKSAVYGYHGKQSFYDKRSLFIFTANCFVRKAAVWIVDWRQGLDLFNCYRFFEYFILFIIFLNSMTLVAYDYGDRDSTTDRNKVLDIMGLIFTVIFTIECALKIIAYGFIIHRCAYLRTGWNLIDFAVVISGIIEMLPVSSFSLRSLRTLRILRPLRGVGAVPSMKKNISALIQAIPEFFNVVFFLFFIFILFAILGVHQYSGIYNNRCRINPFPETPTSWAVDPNLPNRVCSKNGMGLYSCPTGYYCGNPSEYGISLDDDGVYSNNNIYYGIHNFDDLGKSLLTVFQITSTDSWYHYLSNLADADIPFLAGFYCIMVVVVGTFFLMNLILAVIIQAFINIQKKEIDEQIVKMEKEKELLREEEELQQAQHQQNNKEQDEAPGFRHGNADEILSPELVKKSLQADSEPRLQLKFSPQRQTLKTQLTTKEKTKSGINTGTNDATNQNFLKVSEMESLASALDESTRNQLQNLSATKILEQDPRKHAELIKSIVSDHQKQVDLSFLKPISTKRKVVKILTNSIHTPRSPQIEETKEQDEEAKENTKHNMNTQTEMTKPNQSINFAKMIQELQERRQQIKIEEPEKKEEVQSNLLTVAFDKFMEKKRKEQLDIDNYFNEIFQEAKENYKREKTQLRKQNSMRQLAALKLGMRLQRKQNDLSKHFKKFQNEYRAEKNRLYYINFKISQNAFFSFFITMCIITNTIILSLDRYPMDEQEGQILEQINIAFTIIFVFEMIIKLLGFGFKGYFQDQFNKFDCLVVLASVIDLFVSNLITEYNSGGPITAFRAFRLLRVFKLAKSWKKLQNLLKTVGKTLIDISTFSILLFLFMFVYSLLGMEMFGFQAKFDAEGNIDMLNGEHPDANFNNFLEAFTTNFIVLTGDSWSLFYFNYYRASGAAISTIFFITLIIIGQKIILNLFLAILLENFDEDSLNQEIKQQFRDKNLDLNKLSCIEKAFRCIKISIEIFFNLDMKTEKFKSLKEKGSSSVSDQNSKSTSSLKANTGSQNSGSTFKNTTGKSVKKTIKDPLQKLDQFTYLDGRSLWILKMDNKIRQFLFDIVTNPKFDYFIVFVIMISAVELAVDNPLNDPNGSLKNGMAIVDIITTVIFTLESLVKIITFGFVLNGRTSYLRNPWNMLDFIIIVLSIISLTPLPSELRIIKILRVIRPLRLISRNKGLKVAVLSLVQAIPNIINVSVITLLFFLIFGIIAVNYFKGMLYQCNTANIPNLEFLSIESKWDCFNAGGTWFNNYYAFDNILMGIKTLFQISTMTGWAKIMYSCVATTAIDYEPIQKNNPYWAIFFIAFMMIGSFFLLNLFVGVVISNFNRERDNIGGNNLLTDRQKEWIDIRLLVIGSKPEKKLQPPSNIIRKICFLIQENKFFENFILICIVLNTLVLMLKWNGQSEAFTSANELINYIFSGIFAVEAIIKIVALGKVYFNDGWNIFDFVVAVGSIISIFVTMYTLLSLSGATTIIRAFRISRVFRLIKRAQSLRLIFNTFIVTLPALVNVGGLLLLLLYIYSVLGVYLFAEVKRNGIMNDMINYESFPNAFVTLFVIATGDSWDEIVDATIKQKDVTFQCIHTPTYSDYVQNGFQTIGCGPGVEAQIFYYSYLLLVNVIFLNLFIAIILQGFEDTQMKESRLFNNDTLVHFRKIWAEFDPEATSFININQLKPLLFKLGAPLGWDKSYDGSKMKQDKFIINLNLPIYNDFQNYQFLDVLDALSLRLMFHENFVKEQKKKEQEDDELESVESPSTKKSLKKKNTVEKEEQFRNEYNQDINKLKFQEEAQEIEAVKMVANKELRIQQSTNNLQQDKFTSLHQAAAEVAFNHMKYIVAKKKLMKKIDNMENSEFVEIDEVINQMQNTPSQRQEKKEQLQLLLIKQNSPINHIVTKEPENQRIINDMLSSNLRFRQNSIRLIKMSSSKKQSPARSPAGNNSIISNKKDQSHSQIGTPSLDMNSHQNSSWNDIQVQQLDEEIKEDLLHYDINKYLVRARMRSLRKNRARMNQIQPSMNRHYEIHNNSRYSQNNNDSNLLQQKSVINVSMGGTGDQIMLTDDENIVPRLEPQPNIVVEDNRDSIFSSSSDSFMDHIDEVTPKKEEATQIIQDELNRLLQIPQNQRYIKMIENASDNNQSLREIKKQIVNNTDFIDEIEKAVAEIRNYTPIKKKRKSMKKYDQDEEDEYEEQMRKLEMEFDAQDQ